jgi:hypothetical protein
MSAYRAANLSSAALTSGSMSSLAAYQYGWQRRRGGDDEDDADDETDERREGVGNRWFVHVDGVAV